MTRAANAVLPPWRQAPLTAGLVARPTLAARPTPEAERPPLARWETWLGRPPQAPLPPWPVSLIWDHLAGHLSPEVVEWLFHHGILPLYPPLSGSWLTLAEALQRIVGRRALAGQPPQTPQEIITWREETVAGWNAAPRPSCGAASGRSAAAARANGVWGAQPLSCLIINHL